MEKVFCTPSHYMLVEYVYICIIKNTLETSSTTILY